MGELMPMEDALVVWAEEGRVYRRDNNDEPLNRRYQSLVSEWGNPFVRKYIVHEFIRWREPRELKHLST